MIHLLCICFQCNAMIRVYGHSIANLIKEHDDSLKICNKLSLCSANDFLVRLTKVN